MTNFVPLFIDVSLVRKYLVPRNLRSGRTEYFRNIRSASEIFSPPRNARVKTCMKWGVRGAEVAYSATDEQSER